MEMGMLGAALGLTLFPTLCTTAGAAAVFFLRKPPGQRSQRMLLGFAAGVMLAASIWSLILPSIERSKGGLFPAWLPPAAGLCIGAFGLLWIEEKAGKMLAGGKGHSGRVVLAITLHNLPEGMVVGLAAALALSGSPDALTGAMALSLGIGLQNIPEGASVSFPIRQAGGTRWRAFWGGTASGLVEPAGALLAVLLANWVAPAMPWLMAAAAGAMVCVTAQEMIPQAAVRGRAGIVSIMLGFTLMMIMDVAL
ncbi:MAG: ZIP family metal transporter [Faecalibacterium sp.]|jgi:ZIP family zinc transporter|nr:ZIP family metal transporter [Faecalibacterium sp.]